MLNVKFIGTCLCMFLLGACSSMSNDSIGDSGYDTSSGSSVGTSSSEVFDSTTTGSPVERPKSSY